MKEKRPMPEQSTTHTPTPWETKRENDYVPAQIWADGRQVAEVYGESYAHRRGNAEIIVRAVNSHDALVEALEALEPYLATKPEMLDYASLNEGRASSFDVASLKAREALASVRAAR